MRVQKYIDKLQQKNILQEDDKVIVVLNSKPLVAYMDADNEEGWVDVPNLSTAKVNLTEADEPEAPLRVDIVPTRLEGQVEFAIFRPTKEKQQPNSSEAK